MNTKDKNLMIKLFFLSFSLYRLLKQILNLLLLGLKSILVGFWLGILNRSMIHRIDFLEYEREQVYFSEEHNQRGLWDWEEEVINKYFYHCKKILVTSVGGGREVLTIRRKGLLCDGFECNPKLALKANILLEKNGFQGNISDAPRDSIPDNLGNYNGVIVGWGAYTLIKTQQTRINFLKNLNRHLSDEAPIMLSFFIRKNDELRFKLVAAIANFFAKITKNEKIEIGDVLNLNYQHFFTKAELEYEIRVSGFQMLHFAATPYGYLVAKKHNNNNNQNGVGREL